jgi:hypothetical protein
MIRTVGTKAELLNRYDTAQKVVLRVLTSGATIYVAAEQYQLGQLVSGKQQGTPIADTDGNIGLDVIGEIWWIGSAAGVQVDVLETGTL